MMRSQSWRRQLRRSRRRLLLCRAILLPSRQRDL
uniref:Uncharacterized protein n=1 Tax=Arundo donax TaxID=35708 RepID=A0A0A9DVE2_ARUDO